MSTVREISIILSPHYRGRIQNGNVVVRFGNITFEIEIRRLGPNRFIKVWSKCAVSIDPQHIVNYVRGLIRADGRSERVVCRMWNHNNALLCDYKMASDLSGIDLKNNTVNGLVIPVGSVLSVRLESNCTRQFVITRCAAGYTVDLGVKSEDRIPPSQNIFSRLTALAFDSCNQLRAAYRANRGSLLSTLLGRP